MKKTKRRAPDPHPAPGELETVQAFLNTANLHAGRDEIGSPRQLERWLAGRGLSATGARMTDEDHRRALVVRDALRSLLAANNGRPFDPRAVDRLDEAMGETQFQLRFDTDGACRFDPVSDGIDGALGRLFEIVSLAHRTGEWKLFKACASKSCQAAFFDTKDRGKWCSRRCGDRIRARAYRRGDRYKFLHTPRPRR